jgi:hypothetical protein
VVEIISRMVEIENYEAVAWVWSDRKKLSKVTAIAWEVWSSNSDESEINEGRN